MDSKTVFTKTAKGLMEATGKTSVLSRDLRGLLKEIDGKATVAEVQTKIGKVPEAKLLEALKALAKDDFIREFAQAAQPAAPSARAPATAPPKNPAAPPPKSSAASEGMDLDFTMAIPTLPNIAKQAEEAAKQKAQAEAAARAKAEAEARAKAAALEKAKAAAAEAAARARAEAEARARAAAEAAARAKAEAEAKARAEAEEKAKAAAAEAAARAKAEAEARAKAEAEAKAKAEAEARAKAEEQARIEAEERARKAAEERARVEAELKARLEEERKAREEAERKAKEEAERQRKEAEERARREADELRAKLEEERKAREEAERKAKEEAERERKEAAEKARREADELRAKLEEERKAREVAERKEAEEKARREADELRAKLEEERRAREEAERKAKEQAERERKEAEEKARREADELRAKLEEERKAREEAERKAKEQAERERKEAEEKARREAEELRAKLEEERRAREDAERKAKEQAERQAKEQAERQAKEQAERERKEIEEKARREADELRAKIEEERKAHEESERQAKEQVERERKDAEDKARRETDELRARIEEERKAKEEAERRTGEDSERKSREDAERKAKEQAEREANEQAEREANEQAEREAKEHAEREAKEHAEREAKEHAERVGREEAEGRARREAEERRSKDAEATDKAGPSLDDLIKVEIDLDTDVSVSKVVKSESARPQAGVDDDMVKALEEKARREVDEKAKLEAEEKARLEAETREKEEEEESRRKEEEARQPKRVEAKPRAGPAMPEQGLAEAQALLDAQHEETERHFADMEKELDAEAAARKGGTRPPEPREDARKRDKEAARARMLAGSPARAESSIHAIEESVAAEEARVAYRKPVNWGKPAALGLFLILILGVVSVHFISFNGQIPQFEKLAGAYLQQPVKIKALHLSLVPLPHWRLDGITVGDDGQLSVAQIKAVAELGSMFGDKKVFKSLELESPELSDQGLLALLFGKPQGQDFKVSSVIVKNAKLNSKTVTLPVLDAKIAIGEDGAWQKIALETPDHKTSLLLEPKGEDAQLEVETNAFSMPFGPAFILDNFSAKGVIGRNELRLSEFKGGIYGGYLSGTASLKWGADWSLGGEISARAIEPGKLLPALFEDGKLEGKGTYAMRAKSYDDLFAAPRVEGTFEMLKGSVLGVDLTRLLQGGGVAGKTAFSELTGTFVREGGRTQLRQIRLAAGPVSAGGVADADATKNLSGRFAVELKSPVAQARANLALSGNLREPRFSR